MIELTLDQLRFARAIGATHYWRDCFWKSGEANSASKYIYGTWVDDKEYCDPNNPERGDWDKEKINFTPLDEAKQPEKQIDMVNKPPHYQTDNGIECIDAIRAALGLDGFIAYCRGNAIKYGWRAGKKDETAQDLRKAAWYLERAAQELGK